MKPYFTILIVFLVICHQKTAKVDFPLPEDQLIHFVHHIIDQKKVSKIDSFFTFRYESGLFNGNVLIAELVYQITCILQITFGPAEKYPLPTKTSMT